MTRFATPAWILLGLLTTCSGGGGGSAGQSSSSSGPSWPPAPAFTTSLEKAQGVGTELGFLATRDASGVHWDVADGDPPQREATYDGSGGIILYLCALQKESPDAARAQLLAAAGTWLSARPTSTATLGLFSGLAGRGLVFLALYDALGDSRWLNEAKAMGALVKTAEVAPKSDLFEGPPGLGLFLLKLYSATGDAQWLSAAQARGDEILAASSPSGSGIKIPYLPLNGQTIYYPGLSHGNAGAGYFLCKLALALNPSTSGKPYLDGAIGLSKWLDGLKQTSAGQVDWYRREPDQTAQLQWSWCHGNPGIGQFYALLWTITGDAAHLDSAKACGETEWARREDISYPHSYACLCHGRAGNAELFLTLYRVTHDSLWLTRAQDAGDRVWAMRRGTGWPDWLPGNGAPSNMPGLYTGMAGVGYFYLQLAAPDRVLMPVIE